MEFFFLSGFEKKEQLVQNCQQQTKNRIAVGQDITYCSNLFFRYFFLNPESN